MYETGVDCVNIIVCCSGARVTNVYCCYAEIVYTCVSAPMLNGAGPSGEDEEHPDVVVHKILDNGATRNTGVIIFKPLSIKPDCGTGNSEMVR